MNELETNFLMARVVRQFFKKFLKISRKKRSTACYNLHLKKVVQIEGLPYS